MAKRLAKGIKMVKALIIIDMEKGYMKDIYNPKEIIKNQVKLIKAFNKKKLPVIITTGKARKKKNPVMDRLWEKETTEFAKKGLDKFVPEIEKAKVSKVLGKSEYDCFYGTELEKYCKQNKITDLYLCGVFSGCCVYLTGTGAAYRGIMPYFVKDAVSTEKNLGI